MASPDEVDIRLIPRGSTALYDAVGQSVVHFGELLEAMDEDARPGTVQVIVVTDGEENSSKEFSAAEVKRLVTQQTETYSWGFVFLGANQDAVLTGATLGFCARQFAHLRGGSRGRRRGDRCTDEPHQHAAGGCGRRLQRRRPGCRGPVAPRERPPPQGRGRSS